jgi:hypothetical protein
MTSPFRNRDIVLHGVCTGLSITAALVMPSWFTVGAAIICVALFMSVLVSMAVRDA